MTGFICLYKPKGITSFTAVAKVRRITGEKKIGHCGTLDPMATGVLPIMLGGATKFLNYLPEGKKRYTAVMRLGLTTDTLDITGEVTATSDVTVGLSDVERAAEEYKGDIMQVPPMYSAIKKDGVRMYDLARQGIEVERQARPAVIHSLRVLTELTPELSAENEALGENEYILDVECSKGTYIRTLIDDIGRTLGCGAVMTALIRTASYGFTLDKAVHIEELEAAALLGDEELQRSLMPVESALSDYPMLTLTSGQAARFSNGGALNSDRIADCKEDLLYRVASPSGEFLGLGELIGDTGMFKAKRIYVGR